jgi:ABC-2 type transport system ATP-binding protein
VAPKPSVSQTGYSLEDALARFDVLSDQLSAPIEAEIDEVEAEVEPTPEAAVSPAETVSEPPGDVVLSVSGLSKSFGDTMAVDNISLEVFSGSIFGVVGPNGAGKTTTLSMITGLLRPDAGTIRLAGVDVWDPASKAKREMGVLPDRLILFDRLTGRQLLHYTGLLQGLDRKTVKSRTADLIGTIGLGEAQDRLVTDYSAGMTKKVALAAAMIHAPRLLVLDEPFESVDTVSAERITEILHRYVAAGGTVVLSSHSMDLIERICDRVVVVVDGRILSSGTVAEVRGDQSLEDRFIELVNLTNAGEDLEWLRSFSD